MKNWVRCSVLVFLLVGLSDYSPFYSLALAGCGHKGCEVSATTKVCGRCRDVKYCSLEHQRKDWVNHKKVCQVSREHLEVARVKYPLAVSILESISKIGFNFSGSGEVRSADGASQEPTRYFNLALVPRHKDQIKSLSEILVGDQMVGVYPILLEREHSVQEQDGQELKGLLEQRLRMGALFILREGGAFELPFQDGRSLIEFLEGPDVSSLYLRPNEGEDNALPNASCRKVRQVAYELRTRKGMPGVENLLAVLVPEEFRYTAELLFPKVEVIGVPKINQTLNVCSAAFGYGNMHKPDQLFGFQNIPNFTQVLEEYLSKKPAGMMFFTHAVRLSKE